MPAPCQQHRGAPQSTTSAHNYNYWTAINSAGGHSWPLKSIKNRQYNGTHFSLYSVHQRSKHHLLPSKSLLQVNSSHSARCLSGMPSRLNSELHLRFSSRGRGGNSSSKMAKTGSCYHVVSASLTKRADSSSIYVTIQAFYLPFMWKKGTESHHRRQERETNFNVFAKAKVGEPSFQWRF